MGVASGTTPARRRHHHLRGEPVDRAQPRAWRPSLGIAIVHQHPAVLPDMTVAENIRVAVAGRRSSAPAASPDAPAMRAMLAEVGCHAPTSTDRVEALSVAQKHLLEIAKALAMSPAAADPRRAHRPARPGARRPPVRAACASAAAAGTAVVYITHRLAEVRELADRVTVLRDGKLRGTLARSRTSPTTSCSRSSSAASSSRPSRPSTPTTDESVTTARGRGPHRRRLHRRHASPRARGEIVGIAGVVGNGQSALLRALAGLQALLRQGRDPRRRSTGRAQLIGASAYLPADRHREGLMMSLSVRENAALTRSSASRTARSSAGRRRSRRVDRELRAARGQDAVARGRRQLAVRRQPAEGRARARAAVASRRSSSPTSRRRASTSARVRRSTASCARCR